MSRWDLFDVAFIGTSLTARQTSGSWLDACQSVLQLQVGRPLRFYDFGVPGATSAMGLAAIGSAVRMRPKCTVVEFSMNDSVTALDISVATMKANLTSMVAAIAAGSADTQIFLMTMNPAIAPGAVNVPNLASYYQGVRDVAAAQGVGLIDNTPLWGTPSSGQMLSDGIHPTGAAALAVVVPSVVGAIAPIII